MHKTIILVNPCAVHELVTFAENNEAFYDSYSRMCRHIAKAKQAGDYDPEKAKKMLTRLVDYAAIKYVETCLQSDTRVKDVFNSADKKQAIKELLSNAEELIDFYIQELKEGKRLER